ncbi:hypothetical protein HY993_00145 [Candidatus Micrarchaeota archaeon]|nr:hypothetical protein [Candidatus Micrarchaeota archaeon]
MQDGQLKSFLRMHIPNREEIHWKNTAPMTDMQAIDNQLSVRNIMDLGLDRREAIHSQEKIADAIARIQKHILKENIISQDNFVDTSFTIHPAAIGETTLPKIQFYDFIYRKREKTREINS